MKLRQEFILESEDLFLYSRIRHGSPLTAKPKNCLVLNVTIKFI